MRTLLEGRKRLLLNWMMALSFIAIVQTGLHAQKDFQLRKDSSLIAGTLLVHSRDDAYEVRFRCDTCADMVLLSPYDVIAVRKKKGEVLRSFEAVRPNEHNRMWLEEMVTGEFELYRHKPSDSYYIKKGDLIEEVPDTFSDIKRLFASHLDTSRVFPENQSTYQHKTGALQRLTEYTNAKTYLRYPISGLRLGGFISVKGLSFEGSSQSQESYVRNEKTYWSYGYGVYLSHDIPLKSNGWVTWQNEVRLVHNILETDDEYSHFQNAIEIFSLFGQFRSGAKLISLNRKYSPYIQIGGGINFLLLNDDTFLRVVESADGYDIDYGDIENFAGVSFLPFLGLGMEIPIGRKILECEVGAEYEKYGNFDYVWTFYLTVGVNIN